METSAKLKCVLEQEPPEKKMWQCDRCEKEFSKKYNLDRHLVLHTGNFRWYCEMCRKGFSQKDLYSSHMRSHEGLKYRCEYCGKSFTLQITLKYHLSEHTGNYRLKCEHRSEGFNLLRQYDKHMLKHQTA